jgi:hypothetical protein
MDQLQHELSTFPPGALEYKLKCDWLQGEGIAPGVFLLLVVTVVLVVAADIHHVSSVVI